MTISRRELLATSAALAVTGSAAADHHEGGTQRDEMPADASKGRVRQTVCQWCYRDTPFEELAKWCVELGLVGIDLVKPSNFGVLKEHGLVCSMTPSHGIARGLNDPGNWDDCLKAINEAIEATAAEGWKNVICFSGNRNGMSDDVGLKNCAEALKKIAPVAEEAGVTLQMELLNSRVNHPDYMCDKSEWGVRLVNEVGSDAFRLLYDIYHMQIMEGDLIRTIERDHAAFGHYHTAGNPGRHELDDSQELQYAPIIRAIAETGFEGFLGQEFIPTKDPRASLEQAVAVCTV